MVDLLDLAQKSLNFVQGLEMFAEYSGEVLLVGDKVTVKTIVEPGKKIFYEVLPVGGTAEYFQNPDMAVDMAVVEFLRLMLQSRREETESGN